METTTAKILIIRFAGRFDSSALFIVLIKVKYNCCVPNCSNSWRNSPGLKFHTVPKDKGVCKEYKRLIRNVNLKEDSTRTRICGAHFPKGERMSRNQLPSFWVALLLEYLVLPAKSFQHYLSSHCSWTPSCYEASRKSVPECKARHISYQFPAQFRNG